MNLPQIYQQPSGVPLTLEPLPAAGPAPVDDRISLVGLLTLLRRRRLVVIVITALCFLAALLWTMVSPKVFTTAAMTTLVRQTPDLVPGDRTGPPIEAIRPEDVETQVQLIESREMARDVLYRLKLMDDPTFRADMLDPRSRLDNLKTSLGLNRTAASGPSRYDRAQLEQRAIGFLTNAVTAARVGNSYSIGIAVTDSDPKRAAAIANAYATLFTTDDARQRANRNATSAGLIAARLAEVRRQATADYSAVQRFRIQQNLLSASATGLAEQEISTYNQQIAEARARASEDAARLASARAQLRSAGAGAVGEGTQSQVIGALRSQRALLVTKQADLVQRYLPSHPEVVTVRQQIADIDRQIDAEIGRTVRSLEAASQASSQKLASLQSSLGGARSKLASDNGALVPLADLQKRADASQALYESYLNRYREIVASTGTEQPNARLISLATVPVLPFQPNVPLTLAMGLLVGALLGVVSASMVELVYRGLTTADDVEQRLGVRSLGFIPDYRTVKPRKKTALETLNAHPDGAFAESLRNLVASMGQAADGRGKVVAITSALPGEGKTTIASCLGTAMAMSNENVVVVDCDVIRPQLSRTFGFSNEGEGLRSVLQNGTLGGGLYEEATNRLRIIPITEPFAKGERLTQGGRLLNLVAQLREQFDVVILDCAPILPIAETREIVRMADNVVIVARWRKTFDSVIRTAIKQLPVRALKDLGVVLNAVDMRKRARFGGSDSGAFYRYYEQYYTAA